MSVAACSCELISLRGHEVSQGGPTSAAPPGAQLYLSPTPALCQALQNLPAAENSPLLWRGALGCRACTLLLTDPETQTGFFAGLQAPGRALAQSGAQHRQARILLAWKWGRSCSCSRQKHSNPLVAAASPHP